MRELLSGLAVLPFLASIASAGQPLSDPQMDEVIAGFAVPTSTTPASSSSRLSLVITPTGSIVLAPYTPPPPPPPPLTCICVPTVVSPGASQGGVPTVSGGPPPTFGIP